MEEKLVVVHKSYIEEWASRENPPLPLPKIHGALGRIEDLIAAYDSKNVVIVEQSPSTRFPVLNDRVREGDSVVLVGARAAYCLRLAREVLEGIGARVSLDTKGSLS